MDAELVKLARRQDDVVASWQLRELEWTWKQIACRTAGMQSPHSGVFITSLARPSERQLWRAATLTAPNTKLSHRSALACWGLRPTNAPNQTVTRQGNGGPRYAKTLLVYRSPTIEQHSTVHNGIPITTVPRTLADCTPSLDDKELRKATREAIRQRLTTAEEILETASPRKANHLRALATAYARLPLARCKSDAEAYALEVLDAARTPIPDVNEVIAGEEADFSWPHHRLIVEIDGPQWHRFKDEDARKTKAWRKAGWEVERIPSTTVFDNEAELIALVPSGR